MESSKKKQKKSMSKKNWYNFQLAAFTIYVKIVLSESYCVNGKLPVEVDYI